MQIVIQPPLPTSPPHKIAHVELVFDEGPLKGLKLTGLAVWRTEAGLAVTYPSRRTPAGTWFNFLRPAGDAVAPLERLSAQILAEVARDFGPSVTASRSASGG